MTTGIAYQPLSDLLNTITHGNGLVTTAGYDLDYRLTSLNLKNGTTVIQGNTYAYGDGYKPLVGLSNFHCAFCNLITIFDQRRLS